MKLPPQFWPTATSYILMFNYRHWKVLYPTSEDILVVWILYKLFVFKSAPLIHITLLLKYFKNRINKKITITDDRVLLKILHCTSSYVIMFYGTMWCPTKSLFFFLDFGSQESVCFHRKCQRCNDYFLVAMYLD